MDLFEKTDEQTLHIAEGAMLLCRFALTNEVHLLNDLKSIIGWIQLPSAPPIAKKADKKRKPDSVGSKRSLDVM